MFLQDLHIEDKRNKAIKNYPKPKSVRDIQVFIWFANFYWQFIQSFSKITTPDFGFVQS